MMMSKRVEEEKRAEKLNKQINNLSIEEVVNMIESSNEQCDNSKKKKPKKKKNKKSKESKFEEEISQVRHKNFIFYQRDTNPSTFQNETKAVNFINSESITNNTIIGFGQ